MESGAGAPRYSTACPDWERRIAAGEPLVPFAPLFADSAARCMSVYDELRLVDVVDQPTMREITRPWLRAWVESIFGAYDSESGRRLVNEFFLLISKKNSKSSTAAAVMLTALITNWRPSAEFLILAPTKEIADNCFKPMRDMVRADEELSALFQVQTHVRTITHMGIESFVRVVAADSDTVSGKKATGVFVDELHEFGKQPHADNMLLEATGGLTSRPEGFVIYATTQSERPPAGVFKEKLQYARDVRDGVTVDQTFLPVLYEFPRGMIDADAHLDMNNAWVTNPNMGLSVDRAYLEKRYRQARNAGDAQVRLFLSKHLNVEVGLALRDDSWAGAKRWAQQGRECGLEIDEILKESDAVAIGIDGGGAYDWLGLAVIGRRRSDRQWLTWSHAWVVQDALDRFAGEAQRWRDFAKDGDLGIVETLGQAAAQATQICKEVAETGLLVQIGADPEKTFAMIHDDLVAGGLPADKLIKVAQGWRLQGPMTVVERRLSDGTIWHSGSPMMAYCVGNAKLEIRPQSAVIAKHISGGKIDPLMALLDAAAVLNTAPPALDIDAMIGVD